MRHAAASALLALLCSVLAGCGFHLRGQAVHADSGWAVVTVRDAGVRNPIGRGGSYWYADGRDGLRHELVHQLAEAGFTLDANAPLVIELLDASVRRKAASLDAKASAAEYQVDCEARFRVVGRDGATLIPENTVHADSTYRFNTDAVLGSAEQEVVLYEDLRRELAHRIVDQLRRRAARQAPPVPPAAISDHAAQP